MVKKVQLQERLCVNLLKSFRTGPSWRDITSQPGSRFKPTCVPFRPKFVFTSCFDSTLITWKKFKVESLPSGACLMSAKIRSRQPTTCNASYASWANLSSNIRSVLKGIKRVKLRSYVCALDTSQFDQSTWKEQMKCSNKSTCRFDIWKGSYYVVGSLRARAVHFLSHPGFARFQCTAWNA